MLFEDSLTIWSEKLSLSHGEQHLRSVLLVLLLGKLTNHF